MVKNLEESQSISWAAQHDKLCVAQPFEHQSEKLAGDLSFRQTSYQCRNTCAGEPQG